jgi:tRNA threonylcarbamoyl adenosine modification protein YjeE
VERITTSAEETEQLGAELASELRPGDVLLLDGDLAAGKTTLVRGLVRGLEGEPGDVSSPSFVIVHTYECVHRALHRLHHIDLYRIPDETDSLREIGLEEHLSDPEAAVALEWPRPTVVDWLPADARTWSIRLEIIGADARRITVSR